MGMSLGINRGLALNSGGGAGWTPNRLFASGTGAYYDFTSGAKNLYTTSRGVTLTTAGGLVGLAYDKQANFALGPELITNGTFDEGITGWTNAGTVGFDATWDATNQRVILTRDGSSRSILRQSIPTTLTRYYKYVFSRDSSQNIDITVTDGATSSQLLSSGTITVQTGGTTLSRDFFMSSSGTIWLDNISAKEVSGYIAIQTTDANRPTWTGTALDCSGGKSLTVSLPNLGSSATLAYADENGVTILSGQTISGTVTLPQSTALRGVIYLNRALTAGERSSLIRFWDDTYADIYVNATSGNDSYDGLSRGRAKATISAAETAAVAFGDGATVGLEYGEIWREHLDLSSISGAGVVGVGDSSLPLPHLCAADIASPGDFSLAPTYTNTYQITWTHEVPDNIGKNKLSVWVNGTRLKWVSSVALCEAEAGTFHVSNSSIANPATIYVHSTGSTNPTSDGKTYEITARQFALTPGANYTVRHVHTSKQGSHDGSFLGGENGYGYGILSTDGVVHNQWVSVGCTHESCVAYRCEPSAPRSLNATLFVTFKSSSALGATYRQCYAYSDSPAGNAHDGFYAHTSGGSARLTRVTFEDCSVYSPSATISSGDTDYFTASNIFLEAPAGVTGAAIGGVGALATTIDNAVIINGYRALASAANLVANDLRIYTSRADTAGHFFNLANYEVTSSTFVFASGLTEGQNALSSGTADGPVWTDNVVQNAGFFAVQASAGADVDRNVYRTPTNGSRQYLWYEGAAYTFPNWQAQSGYDANSVYQVSDSSSLVTDPANNDWTFTSTIVDEGGRTAGSRKNIVRPDWSTLTTAWDAGYLGIDGTGP